jgi:hypothetical protein
MTAGAARNGQVATYRVVVEEHMTPALTGRGPRRYESPPHERWHALALAGLLVGRDPPDLTGEGPWWQAIVGGRRAIGLAALKSEPGGGSLAARDDAAGHGADASGDGSASRGPDG